MLCNIHRCVLTSIISQTPLFVLKHFNFMYQAKKFGAETFFIPYFSPLGPPSPCSLVSAVTTTFLLEPPARNEGSSSGPPLGDTNRPFRNSSQNPSLQHWYWQVVLAWRVLYIHIVSEEASLTRIRRQVSTSETKTEPAHSWKVAILLHFRSLCHFHSANNFWPSAERLVVETSSKVDQLPALNLVHKILTVKL